jgi:pectin methylesterase-like acyl-CoA thioesterase
MRMHNLKGLALALALGLSLTACKDTKTLQENGQLKAQVLQLQKENGQLGNDLETVTAARNALSKENAALKTVTKSAKPKRAAARASRAKSRRSSKAKQS